MTALRRAAFLDRDGTINVDTIHVSDAALVTLIPGAAAAVRRLNEAGIPIVVVTNQSGIGRGFFTEADFRAVNARIVELLAAEGAHFDQLMYCPHIPDTPCECRKPGLLNYNLASAELHLDPSRSLFVGDRISDVLPALAFGGMGVLVPHAHTKAEDVARAERELSTALTLGDAVDRFLA